MILTLYMNKLKSTIFETNTSSLNNYSKIGIIQVLKGEIRSNQEIKLKSPEIRVKLYPFSPSYGIFSISGDRFESPLSSAPTTS